MVDLFCTPFVELIDRMRLECRQQRSMFDLPARKWYVPPVGEDALDLSVKFHNRVAGNPVGPASGPQTQMAQNLVLSWLAGGRIMELKTVQENDRLYDRPALHRRHQCRLQHRMVAGAARRGIARPVRSGCNADPHAAPRAGAFGEPFGDVDLSGIAGETIYDMSIGYDLAGIQSEKVRRSSTA